MDGAPLRDFVQFETSVANLSGIVFGAGVGATQQVLLRLLLRLDVVRLDRKNRWCSTHHDALLVRLLLPRCQTCLPRSLVPLVAVG
jgi:hypothetical protein